MKTCKGCKQTLELDEFPIAKSCKDGHASWCKPCMRAKARKHDREIRAIFGPRVRVRDNTAQYQKRVQRRQQLQDQMIADGTMPLCACGCGKPVKLDYKMHPQKYAHYSNPFTDLQVIWKAQQTRKAGNIPKAQFCALARKMKAQYGITWKVFEEWAGLSEGQMRSLEYDRRTSTITHERATRILRNVQAAYMGESKRIEKKIRDMGLDPPAPKERLAPSLRWDTAARAEYEKSHPDWKPGEKVLTEEDRALDDVLPGL